MQFVSVLVEGETEEMFVNEVLGSYFLAKGLVLTPVLVKTKHTKGNEPSSKGGFVSYGKVKNDLENLLRNSSLQAVTTMLDYYGLPKDFIGSDDAEAQQTDLYARIAHLERRWTEDIGHPKFIPYLSLHEFEALLFVDPARIVQEVDSGNTKAREELASIRQRYQSPEEINRDEPPSKRVLANLPAYDKIVHGYFIADAIGIEAMRRECPHFDAWLKKLEALTE